ncbi:integral membrane protein [Diaporthe eres]|nr:integral membrane protein [Diaporthe eres]
MFLIGRWGGANRMTLIIASLMVDRRPPLGGCASESAAPQRSRLNRLTYTTYTTYTALPWPGRPGPCWNLKTLKKPNVTVHNTHAVDLSQFSQEYIDYDQGPAVVGVSIAVGLLALASVGLRLWARRMKRVALGIEDYLIIPLLIGTVICAIFAVHLGRVGRHYAVNKIVDPPSYGRGQAALFAVECIYGTLLVVCKFSILAMYWRIFPTPFVKRGCCVLGGMTLAWIIAVALVAFLQCRPMQKIWLPDTPGHCIDNNKFFIGNAVPNIFTDCAIMVLPAYEISRLRMGYSQKIGLAGIFLLGIFVSFISAIRLIFLFQLSAGGKDGDLTGESTHRHS